TASSCRAGSRSRTRRRKDSRTRPVPSAASSSIRFRNPREMLWMHWLSSFPYAWKARPPSRAWIIRPGMGMAWASASFSSPTWASACRPRTLLARLMLRPAEICSLRRSGRRSKTSTAFPRRARKTARSEPTSPAPAMTVRSLPLDMAPEDLGEAHHVGEPRVERRGCRADDVRLPVVADHARHREPVHQAACVADAQRQLCTALGGIGRSDDLHPGEVADQLVHQTGQPLGLPAQCSHPHRIEEVHRGPQRGHREDRWIGELPSLRARRSLEPRPHLEPGGLLVAPPALEAGKPTALPVSAVHEGPAQGARTSVEVLVRAPHGEVRTVVVEVEDEIAGAVGEVEAHGGPDAVAGAG